ncbi:MAG: HAD hydrolase family protein [Dehalococcoidia bacterium]|nr:HAD hydrolase family protein [Dehalococcoidia bacterium]
MMTAVSKTANIYLMSEPYLHLDPETARRIRLLMADVDGTLNTGGGQVSPAVRGAVRRLQENGITVGLVSGRTSPMLEEMALDLDIRGPLIAENGAIARMSVQSGHMDLGYSRQPALDALDRLKACYPGRISEREDNAHRLVDIVFRADGLKMDEIKSCAGDVQVLDSTYILHLMQQGIDKGKTLRRLLGLMDGKIKPSEVLVIGDSMTDLSMFKLFPLAVLVPNPDIPAEDARTLRQAARYISGHQAGDGFVEVALHIIRSRG